MKRWILGRTFRRLGFLLLAFLGAFKSAEWLSDAWWNAALGQSDTYTRIFECRLIAFACGAALWSAILGSNLRLAWFYIDGRAQVLELLGPQRRGESFSAFPQQRGVARARRMSSKLVYWSAIWLAGLAVANRFDLWLPLGAIQSTGQIDPISGRDLAFFFWALPAFGWSWNFFGVALLTTFVTCVALYSSAELIETGPQLFRVAPRAAWHLLTLGATLVLWQGVSQGLAILEAPVSLGWTPNTIFGAPEAHFTVPTRFAFVLTSLPVAGVILWLSRRGRMNSAWGTFGGWTLGALLLPSLAAPFGRSLRIDDKVEQRLAIENHLEATRVAWGLDKVASRDLNVPTRATEIHEPGSVGGILGGAVGLGVAQEFGQYPLWPDSVVRRMLESQETNSARHVGAVHLEAVNGKLVYRALAANPIAQNDFPAVVYEVNATSPQNPTQRRIPISSLLIDEFIAPIDLPRTRYERPDEIYSNTSPPTIAPLPRWRATQQTQFAVARANLWHRLTIGFRFFDTTLFRPGPAVTWRLDPVARARALLPVVDWSRTDPRPAMVGSGSKTQLFWLLDGSFGSRFYPHAAMLPNGDTWQGVNYLRENVLGVVNATTGETSFYLLDPNEPFARSWRLALPLAFRDVRELPQELRSQIRPSPALLEALTTVWSRYHRLPAKDAAREWVASSKNWRQLFVTDEHPAWNTVLPPGQRQIWLSCPFAPAKGQAQSTGVQLVSLLVLQSGVELPKTPKSQSQPLTEWHLTRPLELPGFVGQASPQFVGRQLVPPPPTLTTIFPRLSGEVGSQALLLTHGAALAAPATGVAPALPTPLPSPRVATPRRPEIPQIETQYALWGTSLQVQAPREKESLGRARFLWEQLLQARRASQWSDVARIESDLSRALGVPPPGAATRP